MKRLQSLDFLRGFFIILALIQHYAYFFNYWHVEYTVFEGMRDERLAFGPFVSFLAQTFIFWVVQVYFFLSGLNLGLKTPAEAKKSIQKRWKLLLALVGVFFVEGLLSFNFLGEALSFQVVQLLLLLYLILGFVYGKWGVRGVLGVFAVSILMAIAPMENLWSGIEVFATDRLKLKYFEFLGKPDFFLGSSCLGLLFGVWVNHKTRSFERFGHWFLLGVLGLSLAGIFFTDLPVHDRFDIFAAEYQAMSHWSGFVTVWAIQFFSIGLFLWIERKFGFREVPFVAWVGVHSLGVFLLHRVVFTRLYGPFREHLDFHLGWPMRNNIFEIMIPLLLTCAIWWMIAQRIRRA